MRTVGVIGRKGGIGKTTVAVHLAGELRARGRDVAFVDADPQGSASHWAEPGRLPFKVQHLPVTVDDLEPWLRKIRAIKSDVLILDCPPHLDAALGAAVALSQLVLIPCGPSGLDLLTIRDVLGVVVRARKRRDGTPDVLLVPNRVDRRTTEGRDLVAELGKFGEPVGTALADRSAYVRAFNTGDTVGAFAPGSAADLEVKALADDVERN